MTRSRSGDFSEELLAAHEAKRTELTEELADRQPVLNLLGRYLGLLQEAHELQVGLCKHISSHYFLCSGS